MEDQKVFCIGDQEIFSYMTKGLLMDDQYVFLQKTAFFIEEQWFFSQQIKRSSNRRPITLIRTNGSTHRGTKSIIGDQYASLYEKKKKKQRVFLKRSKMPSQRRPRYLLIDDKEVFFIRDQDVFLIGDSEVFFSIHIIEAP